MGAKSAYRLPFHQSENGAPRSNFNGRDTPSVQDQETVTVPAPKHTAVARQRGYDRVDQLRVAIRVGVLISDIGAATTDQTDPKHNAGHGHGPRAVPTCCGTRRAASRAGPSSGNQSPDTFLDLLAMTSFIVDASMSRQAVDRWSGGARRDSPALGPAVALQHQVRHVSVLSGTTGAPQTFPTRSHHGPSRDPWGRHRANR